MQPKLGWTPTKPKHTWRRLRFPVESSDYVLAVQYQGKLKPQVGYGVGVGVGDDVGVEVAVMGGVRLWR